MDLKKLKLDRFNAIQLKNFPAEIILGISSVKTAPQVIIYYIDKLDDVNDFVRHCLDSGLPEENRTIMVYRKARKDGVNRDSIFKPFQDGTYTQFKLKAPMLCSLSDELSACVLELSAK